MINNGQKDLQNKTQPQVSMDWSASLLDEWPLNCIWGSDQFF